MVYSTLNYYLSRNIIWARRQIPLLLLIAFILIRGVRFFFSRLFPILHVIYVSFYVVSLSMEDASFNVPGLRSYGDDANCPDTKTHISFWIISTLFSRINLCIVHANRIVLLLKWIERRWHSFLTFFVRIQEPVAQFKIHFSIVHCL